ncbi:MAG: cysteine hydrolase family protein [Geothrix sp.]|nr:cysteine hydrolase family protein [Geothrix sp.]
MSKALLVIDLQNDYFPGGAFPLWNPETALEHTLEAITKANAKGMPVILTQHVADSSHGISPFFNAGTPGVEIHPQIRSAAAQAPVVVKAFADSFHQTTLEETLRGLEVTELLVCGMMTQNCVTHTAISKAAEAYGVTILPDCCTTVNEMLHLIALHAVSTRVKLVPSSGAI